MCSLFWFDKMRNVLSSVLKYNSVHDVWFHKLTSVDTCARKAVSLAGVTVCCEADRIHCLFSDTQN
jgi:hypothetical protein